MVQKKIKNKRRSWQKNDIGTYRILSESDVIISANRVNFMSGEMKTCHGQKLLLAERWLLDDLSQLDIVVENFLGCSGHLLLGHVPKLHC